jgi:hypothetical protein
MNICYSVLDKTLLDQLNERCGRVDDVVIEDVYGRPPRIVAIVSANGAKARLFGRLAQRLSVRVHRLLGMQPPIEPVRVQWDEVESIVTDVTLRHTAEVLGLAGLNKAVAKRFIGRIPGSGA